MKPKPAAESDAKALQYLKLAGVLLLLAGAGWFVFRMAEGDKPKPKAKPFATLARYAAEETAKLLGSGARVILVYDIADPKDGGPGAGKPLGMQGTELAAFRSRLSELGKYSFAQDWKLPRPTTELASVWPAGELARFLQTHPPDTALVFFADPPKFSPSEKATLKNRTGKLILLGGRLPEVRGLAGERIAHLIIASRVPVPPSTKAAETPDEWVHRVYAKVTPDQPNTQ